jgi:hypothetical protein
MPTALGFQRFTLHISLFILKHLTMYIYVSTKWLIRAS